MKQIIEKDDSNEKDDWLISFDDNMIKQYIDYIIKNDDLLIALYQYKLIYIHLDYFWLSYRWIVN